MSASATIAGPVPARPEPLHVRGIKFALYAVGLVFYLQPLSSVAGVIAAVCCAALAMALARAAHRKQLRVAVVAVGGPALALLALLLGDRLLDAQWLAGLLGVEGTFVTADIVTFGLAAFCVVFLLRVLAQRLHGFSLLEVLFVAGSVVALLAAHRHRMVNRPRFFSDWAWSMGIDPTAILVGIGAAATLLAILFFLRDQPLLKLLSSLLLLALLGAVFYLVAERRIEAREAADPLGLSDSGGGAGRGDADPFKDDYQQQGPPQPVAVAILRDDYSPENGVLYFRQRALSHYNGHHLVAAEAVDSDVITRFASGGEPARGTPTQEPAHHVQVPTTMYLMVDHPQPPALTHATQLTLVDNPNPQQFVAAYEVVSQVSAVSAKRLLGRRSMPADWSAKRRRHYTEIPDDPRYGALAAIIVRAVDPRFADDDIARAYAIKRFLEREGFYTRRSKHSSRSDPTASFLFGSLRGYCVHFAHAAVYLLRSQGIAARVALGYAVQTFKRSGGSSVLIMGDRAHAWPEIFVDGVGWVTFDIYPERTDMPPPSPVDYDLEKLLGELARNDPTGGLSPEGRGLRVPWGAVLRGVVLLLLILLALAYLVKAYRRLVPALARGPSRSRATYLALLDRLSDIGAARRRGETRERHAHRLAALVPAFAALTEAHLGQVLGSRQPLDPDAFARLAAQARVELRRNLHPLRRVAGSINPLGWLITR